VKYIEGGFIMKLLDSLLTKELEWPEGRNLLFLELYVSVMLMV